MNTSGFIKAAVGAIVIVLVAVSVILPIMATAAETEKTFTNEGFFRMTELTSEDDDVTITWDYSEPLVLNINGEDFNMPTTYTNTPGVFPYTVFASDDWGMRFAYTSDNDRVDFNLYGSGSSALLWYVTSEETEDVSFTFDSGTFTATKGTTTYSTTYDTVYIPNADGEYTLKKGSETAYVLADSLIYSTGRTLGVVFGDADPVSINAHLEGNVVDGVSATIIAPTGYTTSDVATVSESVDGYVDLYTYDKTTFTMNKTATGDTNSAIYSQVIVPYEVTAEISDHPTGAVLTIIQILPVLILVGVLMMIVTAFISNRRA